MKSLLRLAALASLIPISSLAADQPPLDAYKELTRFRVQNLGAAATFDGTTNDFLSQLMADPSSPYSELIGSPTLINETWWPEFTDGLSPRWTGTDERFVELLQWQLGLAKARPGIEIAVDAGAAAAYKGREAAANALKAEVDADIFWKARDMNGSHYAEAAGEAVALQILRDQMRRNTPDSYGARAIKPEVLKRYLAQTNPGNITDADRNYLGDILRYAITSKPSFLDGASRSGLPDIYRVARTAAAYSDASGYVTGPLCAGHEPGPGVTRQWPTDAKPLCFIAASDRAVRAWYGQQLHDEAIRRPPYTEHSKLSNLLHWIGAALFIADFGAFIEVADSFIADDMLADGLIEEEDATLASDRASRLTCGIRP